MKPTTTGGTDAMHLSSQHFAEVVHSLRRSISESSSHERRQITRIDRPPLFVLSRITHCRQMADRIYDIGVQFHRLLNVDTTQPKTIDQIRQSILG